MKKKFHMVSMTVVLLLSISTATEARMGSEAGWEDPSNNGPVYAMMGGHGGMGGADGGGMGYSEGISSLLEAILGRRSDQDRDYGTEREREELRLEIREKRQELAHLFRSDTPDRKLIDQKILELNKLEAELDQKMYGSNNRR